MRVIKPSWNVFDALVAEARSELLICAPWISSAGLAHIRTNSSLKRVEIWARVADVNTDAAGILQMAKQFEAAAISTVIRDSPVLHAKIYLADNSKALLTSANLSDAAFLNNLEGAALITEPYEIAEVAQLLDQLRMSTTVVSLSDLEYFVANERPVIEASVQPEPPMPTPIWRRRPRLQKPALNQPKPVDLMQVVKWIESSLVAADSELKTLNFNEWVGKKATVWVCPCCVLRDISRELTRIAAIYSFGQLGFGERLWREHFTKIEGVIEAVTESNRAVFRKKRSTAARFELTRFPDRGSNTILHNNGREPHFLLKIVPA
jgi:hypothetical protein